MKLLWMFKQGRGILGSHGSWDLNSAQQHPVDLLVRSKGQSQKQLALCSKTGRASAGAGDKGNTLFPL